MTEAEERMNKSALQHPFTCVIVGPTGCGKSQLAVDIIKNIKKTIYPCPTKIVWCYSEPQPSLQRHLEHCISSVDGVQIAFHKGMPDWNKMFPVQESTHPSLVVIDDFMTEVGDKKTAAEDIVNLFAKGSHHRNLSVLFLCQNMFYRGGRNYMRDISLNTHYMFVFKNLRDRTQITYLARQMAPNDWQRVHQHFEDATRLPHQYYLFDLKPQTDEPVRQRTNFIWGALNNCSVIYGCDTDEETQRWLDSCTNGEI